MENILDYNWEGTFVSGARVVYAQESMINKSDVKFYIDVVLNV